MEWSSILERTQLHMNLLEPLMAFRRALLQILSFKDCTMQHLLQSASTFRKVSLAFWRLGNYNLNLLSYSYFIFNQGSRFSQAAAALHEFKFLCTGPGEQCSTVYWLGRVKFPYSFDAMYIWKRPLFFYTHIPIRAYTPWSFKFLDSLGTLSCFFHKPQNWMVENINEYRNIQDSYHQF